MTLTAVPVEATDGRNGEWLIRSHNRLDARLAALLIHACSGARDEASNDFEAYRAELENHLQEAEQRLLVRLSTLGARERVLERLEWKAGLRDLQGIVQAIERELASHRSNAYEMIAALRHALRRQRRQENRLLQLAAIESGTGVRYSQPDDRP